MHWLLSLDHALFHFINSTLANPLFDWLMPILSGNGVPWMLAVAVGVPLGFYFGSTRLKVCALLAVLVVALGDPLVVGTIKDAVLRPRPFVTVPDARHFSGESFGRPGADCVAALPDGSLPPGVNRHSLPSAHAANWFALATLLFLFYRRSARFMYPLAAAVAFSRVYNGVHYPSDVTIGAILGAGYAVAFLVLAQMLWGFIGKKFFPAWHAVLPSLLNPPAGTQSAIGNRQSAIEWTRLGYVVIFLALVGRWVYIASGIVGLSEDEAYQWLWSKHLALSYYSKPPGIALIQWTGTHLFGDTVFGVRFFSPVFAAMLSVLVFRFMARETGARTAFWLLLATFATPLFVLGSVVMTIDPPLVLCWMWAVIAGWRAVQPDGRTRDWIIAGLALGLGFLCKYTAMLQLVCWAIFFVLQPSARVHFKKVGPWLALGVFAMCTLPVMIWNAQHGWITALHVWGDAGMSGPKGSLTIVEQLSKSLDYFLQFTGGEFGALNPIFFLGSLAAIFIAWKRRAEKPLWFFLFCMSAPVFLGHWLFSFHSMVQLNWIAAAVPPMFCLMAAVWSESRLRVKPWFAAALLLGIAASVFMHSTDLLGRIAPSRLPGDVDPSHRVRGWRETAALVEAERAKFDTNAFIIADHYGTTGLYSFYSPPARDAANAHAPLVYGVDSTEIINQFPFWPEYNYAELRRGQNAIFVLHRSPYKLEHGWVWKWLRGEPAHFREIPPPQPAYRAAIEFESVTNLGVREIRLDDGRVFQRVEIFGCYHLK
jgi:membrane-associated phospholipid phosphatase